MLPQSQTPKCPNFVISNQLLGIDGSPLSHSPGYLVKYRASYPDSNRASYSPSYPVRNPESDSAGYPASYRTGHLPENPASYSGSYRDSNSADYSADCRDYCPGRNPESNRESNGADNSPDSSESNSVDSLPDCPASYLPGFGRRKRRFHAARRDTGEIHRIRSIGTRPIENCTRCRRLPRRDGTEFGVRERGSRFAGKAAALLPQWLHRRLDFNHSQRTSRTPRSTCVKTEVRTPLRNRGGGGSVKHSKVIAGRLARVKRTRDRRAPDSRLAAGD